MEKEEIKKIIEKHKKNDKKRDEILPEEEIYRIFSEEIFNETKTEPIRQIIASIHELNIFLYSEKRAKEKFSTLSKEELVKKASILEALVKFLDEKSWVGMGFQHFLKS